MSTKVYFSTSFVEKRDRSNPYMVYLSECQSTRILLSSHLLALAGSGSSHTYLSLEVLLLNVIAAMILLQRHITLRVPSLINDS
jgi:hypothetical protein